MSMQLYLEKIALILDYKYVRLNYVEPGNFKEKISACKRLKGQRGENSLLRKTTLLCEENA